MIDIHNEFEWRYCVSGVLFALPKGSFKYNHFCSVKRTTRKKYIRIWKLIEVHPLLSAEFRKLHITHQWMSWRNLKFPPYLPIFLCAIRMKKKIPSVLAEKMYTSRCLYWKEGVRQERIFRRAISVLYIITLRRVNEIFFPQSRYLHTQIFT